MRTKEFNSQLLLEGIPISPGYASWIAVVYEYEIERWLEVPRRTRSHSEVVSECKRIDVLEQSSQDLKLVEQNALNELMLVESAALFSAHSAMAKDIAALVRQQHGSARWRQVLPGRSVKRRPRSASLAGGSL